MSDAGLESIGPLPVGEVERWDLEAEVVVVGLGAAGACAVLGASEAGVDVLALEAAGAGGGTSAMSGGLIYLGGGTPVQEACGFEDSAEDMFRFLMAASGPDPDEAKIRAYCDGSVAHFDWLVSVGVPFKAAFYPEPGLEPPTEDGLVYSGGEDAYPFDRLARPAPRAHKPQHRHAAGRFLMDRLLAAVAASAARVETDVRVLRLVTGPDDRVVGVVARRAGRTLSIQARRGVVLCAGGFVHNDEMVERHSPLVARCSLRLGNDFDDGRAIRMAQAIGAAVTRMDAAEVAVPITPPRTLVAGILVNGQGQRFINEDTYYGRVGQEILFRQEGEAYLIVDESLYEVTRAGLAASWVAESAAELGEEIGLPPGALEATLALYNHHAVDGLDPVFHKAGSFVRPLECALGAYDLRVTNPACYYATFTLGGLVTSVDGAVTHLDGRPVAGLFAAGRTTSGVAAFGYASGVSLGDGTFFGRRAGLAAAQSPTVASG